MVKQKRICSICKTTGHYSNNSKFHPKKKIIYEKACRDKFTISKYLKHISKIIKDILSRPQKNDITYDILDTEIIIENKMIVLKEKQRQMKIGEIWQEILGNYNGYINLKNTHESGLDIISYTKKIVIELKNRTNTDNASSRKTNLDKLSKFKKCNPEYTCIYANINDSTKDLTLKGSCKTIIYNGVEIKHYIGYKFIEFVFGKDTDKIIDFVKTCINDN